MKKKIPLYVQIIIGMLLGILWGIVAVRLHLVKFTSDWIKPFGTIFINLLKLIAVPLVFASLIKGISGLNNIGRLSKMGLKTLGLYIISMLGAIVIGLAIVNTIRPGNTFPDEKRAEYLQKFEHSIGEKSQAASKIQEQSPLQFLVDMVPENIFAAASQNKNMLQVIVFAILIAVSMMLLPEKKVKPFRKLIKSINDIILKLIDLIMMTAPFGVFALLAGLVGDFSGDTDL
ncbi:MAG: cation:dicarboxylase symporter family transporter, partial [Bacteroidales bacterium]|nr:cation:dicarboxylase symporter family transporter [Bacteroidales bacterium]